MAKAISKTMMNLASNAFEAMPYGGEFTVSTRSESLERPIVGYEYVEPGDYVTLQVRDTGTGIQPEDLGRILESLKHRNWALDSSSRNPTAWQDWARQ